MRGLDLGPSVRRLRLVLCGPGCPRADAHGPGEGGPVKLRKYQEDAISAVLDAVTGGQLQRVAVVLPTGMGKTVIFSHLSRRWIMDRCTKVAILVHRDELISQAVDKIHQVDRDLKVGRVKAGTWDLDADVIVMSVQTVSRPANLAKLEGLASLVIVDECHHASAETWVATLEALGCFSPGGPPCVGFTATLSRTDGRALGTVFQKIVYQKDILDGIAGGHLVNPRGKLITLQAGLLDNVKVSGGDYQVADLGNRLTDVNAPEEVAKAYAELAGKRPGVCFWPTVATAIRATEALKAQGIMAATIWGSMDLEDRRRTLQAYADGEIQVLTNAMVLTEGWDAPRAEVCVIARPTRSPALYVQMVGRVLRPYPGKEDALVLDIAGVTMDHKLATLADLTSGRVKEVQDGESLAEAVERTAREDATAVWALEMARSIQDVDLFRRSATLWLTTDAGCWFIPTGKGFTFLWPDDDDPELYWVGWRGQGGGGSWVSPGGLALEFAMALAEETAERDPGYSKRTASWRKSGGASAAQKDMARRIGLEFAPDVSKRELSDLITVRLASRALDPAFLKVKEARRVSRQA
ncbi:DEAD/DEAH box helicase [Nonomuraea sp. NPDC050733]